MAEAVKKFWIPLAIIAFVVAGVAYYAMDAGFLKSQLLTKEHAFCSTYDLDGDGKLTREDLGPMGHIVFFEKECTNPQKDCDFNKDGRVNEKDYMTMKTYFDMSEKEKVCPEGGSMAGAVEQKEEMKPAAEVVEVEEEEVSIRTSKGEGPLQLEAGEVVDFEVKLASAYSLVSSRWHTPKALNCSSQRTAKINCTAEGMGESGRIRVRVVVEKDGKKHRLTSEFVDLNIR